TGLRGVVNLNAAEPPSWADALADGPLFAAVPRRPDPARLADHADRLLAALAGVDDPPLRIDWHLGEPDFRPSAPPGRSAGAVGLAWAGRPIGFVFDRPRRPVALAEGLDRGHPAVLVQVGLALPVLTAQPGLLADPDRFLQKLGSLARLALS